MRSSCLSLLCSCLLLLSSSEVTNGQPHLDTARKYVGLIERTGNRGPHIDRWNRRVGAPLGSPWCASFVSFCLDAGGAHEPRTRSAWSRAFVGSGAIEASKVLSGEYTPQAGDIVIWRRSATAGHIGFVEKEWSRARGRTVEGNTSSGSVGSQWNGGQVAIRVRTVNLFSHFRITHFVPVRYAVNRNRGVAQIEERGTHNPEVAGANPAPATR